jgi:hypothetical protein
MDRHPGGPGWQLLSAHEPDGDVSNILRPRIAYIDDK